MTATFIQPLPLHKRPSRPRITTKRPPLAQRLPPSTPPSSKTLETITNQIRGEWKGYEGRFTPTGSLIPLPDYYIPEEFSEWGVTPHGFESVYSRIVRGKRLYQKYFRILPSVSLFADHVDTEEEFGFIDLEHPGVSVFDDGSWISGAVEVKRQMGKLDRCPKVEVWLRHPAGERRAVSAVVPFRWPSVVEEVRVVLEEWVCEYCDGADLDGGSGYVEGWVVGEPRESREEGVVLPEGIDFGVGESDGGLLVWVGWAVDGERVVVRRRFDQHGALVYSERLLENAE